MSTQILEQPHVEQPIGPKRAVFGLMAEYETQDGLLRACEAARNAGYKEMDAYTPLPIHGLSEALGFEDDRLQKIVFCGGLIGCLTGFGLMYYITVITYPLNIGGKPLYSWPAYIPPTFETTVLFSAFTTLIALCVLNGFPQPYHPVFNNPRFAMASSDRYFLCVEATDSKFDLVGTRKFLDGTHPREVVEVEP